MQDVNILEIYDAICQVLKFEMQSRSYKILNSPSFYFSERKQRTLPKVQEKGDRLILSSTHGGF